jgi:hypothetical protein
VASFLDLFGVVDSDGAPAARYRLAYIGNVLSHQESFSFGMATGTVYALYKFVAVAANGLMGLVLSSASWLDPLSRFYRDLTAPLFAVAPPWAIACFGLGIVAVSTLRSRPAATTGGMFNSESLNRIGVALAMTMVVVVLTHDPFMLITKTMELANGFSVSLASKLGGGDQSTTTAGSALVDATLRKPTIALNYGSSFGDACRTAWSQAMTAGKELPPASGCFTEGQNRAGPDTLLTAILMLLFPALPMLAFSVIATWKYLLHLTLSVLAAVSTVWVAAGSVHKRRGFDTLAKAFGTAAGHLVMAVLISMAAVALPVAVAGLTGDLLTVLDSGDGDLQVFALMVGLGVGFGVSSWAILRLSANTGVLVRLLHANTQVTLEQTLGVSPATSWKAITSKYIPWSEARSRASAGNATGASRPAAGTGPVRGGPAGNPAAKGADPVRPASTPGDEDAVKELTAPARATADEKPPSTPQLQITVASPEAPGSGGAPAGRAWQRKAGFAPADGARIGDEFGHFTRTTDTDPDSEAAGTGSGSGSVADTAAAAERVPLAGEPRPPEPATGAQTRSAASAPEAAPAPLGSAGAPVPVNGNEFADPALDEVARSVGATFTAAGDPPRIAHAPTGPLSTYTRREVVLDPVPFAVPPVDYRPALQTSTHPGADPAPGSPDVPAPGEEPVNDQQRWNRGARPRDRQADKAGKDTVTSPAAEPELPVSGIGPGVNRHPASFQAPMPDYLAAAALEAEMELVDVTYGAAGIAARIRLPDNDILLSVRLSSDPEKRVTRARGLGFGDPV